MRSPAIGRTRTKAATTPMMTMRTNSTGAALDRSRGRVIDRRVGARTGPRYTGGVTAGSRRPRPVGRGLRPGAQEVLQQHASRAGIEVALAAMARLHRRVAFVVQGERQPRRGQRIREAPHPLRLGAVLSAEGEGQTDHERIDLLT